MLLHSCSVKQNVLLLIAFLLKSIRINWRRCGQCDFCTKSNFCTHHFIRSILTVDSHKTSTPPTVEARNVAAKNEEATTTKNPAAWKILCCIPSQLQWHRHPSYEHESSSAHQDKVWISSTESPVKLILQQGGCAPHACCTTTSFSLLLVVGLSMSTSAIWSAGSTAAIFHKGICGQDMLFSAFNFGCTRWLDANEHQKGRKLGPLLGSIVDSSVLRGLSKPTRTTTEWSQHSS